MGRNVAFAMGLLLLSARGRGAVVPRAGNSAQGTPLLLGPPGATTSTSSAAATTTTADNAADITEAITAPLTASITISSGVSSSQSSTSPTSRATSISTESTVSSADASSTSTAAILQDLHPDPPRQPSSVRYLVPVFLLILATLGVFFFNKSRKRRALRTAQTPSDGQMRNPDPFGGSGGWKEIKNVDHDEEDAWGAGEDEREMQWKEVDLRQADSRKSLAVGASRKSMGIVSMASKSWGWRDTFDNWKSARGRTQGSENREHGLREPTMKLVTPTMVTYHTLPGLDGKPYDPEYAVVEQDEVMDGGERGSIRALRDKLTSLSYVTSPLQGAGGGLERNKSPNKRLHPNSRNRDRDGGDVFALALPSGSAPPPSPPAWIRPRAVSPTQILSPPLQPHLFFHPATSMQSLSRDRQQLITNTDDGEHSCSEYASDYDETATNLTVSACNDVSSGFPRIPSTASALANTFDPTPSQSPKPPKDKQGKDGTIGCTPSKATKAGLKRTPTAPALSTGNGSRLKVPPSPGRRSSPSSPKSSPVLRRSTAVKDLSKPSVTTSPSKPRTAVPSGLSPVPSKGIDGSPRKNRTERVQRKEQRARDKVEDILKASWSDRALSSPTLASQSVGEQLNKVATQPKAQGRTVVPGMMSPGLDDIGGGIEQRLAMLRNIEV